MNLDLSTTPRNRRIPLVVLGLTALLAGTTHSQGSIPFKNCAQAALSSLHDIPRSSPDYAAHLDRDNDGVACESGGKDEGRGTGLNVTLPVSAEQLIRNVVTPRYQGVMAMNVQGRGGPQWRIPTLDYRPFGPVRTLMQTVYQLEKEGAPLTKLLNETASFDQKGRLVRYDSTPVNIKKDRVYDHHVRAIFNASGQVIREDLNDTFGTQARTYTYDAKGNLVSHTEFSDGEPTHLVRYERRPAGVIERNFNLPENEANGITWTVLDRALRVTHTQWSIPSTTFQMFYEYDPAGKMLRATKLETQGPEDAVGGLKKVITTYQGGLRVSEETYSAGTLAQDYEYPVTWQYQDVDTYGNYRKATEFIGVTKNGVMSLLKFREYQQTITYWK